MPREIQDLLCVLLPCNISAERCV
ncbi:RepA leader peptide Tap [Buttiauxella noackiae]|nr:RepA leader peptide Tap [Buttiauxella noackiae]